MKNSWIVLIFSLLTGFSSQAQSTWEFEFLSHWDDDDLPLASPGGLNLQYSGCWGMAVNGREYAVAGGAEHILIFDITDPTAPQLKVKWKGAVNTIWREFKSYKNRLYAVSDASSEGLVIFDFTHAEDSIPLRYWSNALFSSAHTITLDSVSGRIYLNGGDAGGGVRILDISQNPDAPVFLANPILAGGGLHDSYVRNDTLYASSGNNGYYIYDLKQPAQPITLASINTGGYNHNSWLNKAGTYAYYTEEIPAGRPIQIIDLHNLSQGIIESKSSFLNKFSSEDLGGSAIPHNVYIRDNLLFDSQYEDGLLVYDISDPLHPAFLARYDTHPENDFYTGYYGNWGNYPWLPSGNIIACDMQNGLYVLRLKHTSTGVGQVAALAGVQVFPNPVQDLLQIKGNGESALQWTLNDLSGRVLRQGMLPANGSTLDLSTLSPGAYMLRLQDENGEMMVRKIFKD